MFWAFLFRLLLFIIVIGLIIVCMLFLLSPYSCKRINEKNTEFATHIGTGEKIDSEILLHAPFSLKASIQTTQMDLLSHFAQTLTEAKIPFWAINTTLLATVRYGQLMPWDDTISFAVEDDHFREFFLLRAKLEHRGLALLVAGKHGYTYCSNNIARFPRIDITLMKRKDHEVSICTPTDEVRECSFQDSFLRRREVFAIDMVYPLQQSTIGTISIFIPNKPTECLDTRFGKQWNAIPPWTNWKFINNANSTGLLQRLFRI